MAPHVGRLTELSLADRTRERPLAGVRTLVFAQRTLVQKASRAGGTFEFLFLRVTLQVSVHVGYTVEVSN